METHDEITERSQPEEHHSSDKDESTSVIHDETPNVIGSSESEKTQFLQDKDWKRNDTFDSNTDSLDDHDSKLNQLLSTDESMESKDYGSQLLQQGIYYDKEIHVPEELVESLTQGFIEKFIPSLIKNKKTVDQIRCTQNVLIETVQQENVKFEDSTAIGGLEETMIKAKSYYSKLLKLRKEMTSLHDKSSKLKRRALRLQQQRQKDELTRAQTMEAEYEKEKMLTARVATSSSPEKET